MQNDRAQSPDAESIPMPSFLRKHSYTNTYFIFLKAAHGSPSIGFTYIRFYDCEERNEKKQQQMKKNGKIMELSAHKTTHLS